MSYYSRVFTAIRSLLESVAAVTSVAGKTGAVVLESADISDATSGSGTADANLIVKFNGSGGLEAHNSFSVISEADTDHFVIVDPSLGSQAINFFQGADTFELMIPTLGGLALQVAFPPIGGVVGVAGGYPNNASALANGKIPGDVYYDTTADTLRVVV